MSSVYLGGAIDFADEKSLNLFQEISNEIVATLGPDVVIFNPLSAFNNANKSSSPRDDEFVVAINKLALIQADLAVFIWSGALTFGVPIEIYKRVEAGGPILVINTSGRSPGIYMRHFLSQVDGRITSTKTELCAALEDFKIVESGQSNVGVSSNASN